MTVGEAIEQLKQYPAEAELLVHQQSGMDFKYEIANIISARDYLLTSMFDQSAEPPSEDAVYLIIRPEHD